jgi:hypothetical protein
VLLVVLWVALLVCLVLELALLQALQLEVVLLVVALVALVWQVKLRFKVLDLLLVVLGVACLATL